MSEVTTRSRSTPYTFSKGVEERVLAGETEPVTSSVVGGEVIIGTQTTVSEGHPFKSTRLKQGDIGGEFSTSRSYVEGKPSKASLSYKDKFGHKSTYKGTISPVTPSSFGGLWPTSSFALTNSELEEQGAVAVSRCKPTNSPADLTTFLGETIKDGLPRLVGLEAFRKGYQPASKRLAGEHLNYQFSVLPAINDTKKLISAISHAQAVIEQYERDAGKKVRRRYEFPEYRERDSFVFRTDVRPSGPTGPDYWGTNTPRGRVICDTEKYRRRWFSGAFTYQLPSGYDSRKEMDRLALIAQQALGLKLTPEVLWELAPWSWAVDWFSNVGDVVSNISAWTANGLVMQYGYMMEHTVHRHTYRFEWTGGNVTRRIIPAPVSFVTETKKRVRANPFGFGVTWEGLSPLQVSIAAALGISRGR